MRWAVIGDRGLFGAELSLVLRNQGETVNGFNRSNLDLELPVGELESHLASMDVVVNCVAFTASDQAEENSAEADHVNGVLAEKIALASKNIGARFIHISTDYVFDGTSHNPHRVGEATNPINAYGKSKLLGERLVAAVGGDYSILRTAWLFGAQGKCFPKTIAAVLAQKGSARVVADQHGGPTWTKDLALQVLRVAQLESMPPIVHAVASGQATWADFACEVALSLGMDPAQAIIPVASSEYPTKARRPSWSVLDNTESPLGPIGDWRERWRLAAAEVLAN
jgi:dTDP-4-dehydrorhamnose reductase